MKASLVAAGTLAIVSAAPQPPSSVTKGFSQPTFSFSAAGKASCVEGMVPVKASSPMNIHINMATPANQSVVSQVFVDMVTTGSDFMSKVTGKSRTISGEYDIFARLCYPKDSGINAKTVQFLTHGIGFDLTYWDVAPGFSYVDTAAMKGYATLSYDRLGVGKSATPDPIQVVQAPLEVEIAHELILMLRNGDLSSTSFKNVVGVGHSFGSALTTGVAHSYPTAIDVAVLTGYSTQKSAAGIFNSALNLQIAKENDPQRFANLSNGYLVADSIVSNVFDFFHESGYPPENLAIADLTKATVTLGEFITVGALSKPATKFTGAVTVVDGEFDLRFCHGNCRVPTNIPAEVAPALYPKASNSSTYLAAASGHGLNFHYSAEAAYDNIQEFVKSNGF